MIKGRLPVLVVLIIMVMVVATAMAMDDRVTLAQRMSLMSVDRRDERHKRQRCRKNRPDQPGKRPHALHLRRPQAPCKLDPAADSSH